MTGVESRLRQLVKRVILHDGHITIEINLSGISSLLLETSEAADTHRINTPEFMEIVAPFMTYRARRKVIIIEPDNSNADHNKYFKMPISEFKNLIRGIIWRAEHFKGKSIQAIATRERFSEGFIEKCIFKTFELNIRSNPD